MFIYNINNFFRWDSMQNIKWHNTTISSNDRAILKKQKPFVLWFTGLSGSGKSTLANAIEQELYVLQKHTFLLDGDNIRHGLCKDLGFDMQSRAENARRVSEVSKLLMDAGIIVLCSLISPYRKDRQIARSLIGNAFIEIFVDTPLSVCEKRDVKGLYKKARNGEIKNLVGIHNPYEIPITPEIHLNNDLNNINNNVDIILNYLKNKYFL